MPATLQGEGITEDNEQVLFYAAGGELDLLIREGDSVPEAGEGVYIELFNYCFIKRKSEVLYNVKYAGPGITESNRRGIYFGPVGQGVLTLRGQDPAPTFSSEITLSAVGSAAALAVMNDVGDVAALTEIEGPGVTDDDKVVLWLRHRVLDRWIPLLRSGSIIGGRTVWADDPGDFGEAYCYGSGGADGKYQSFNDLAMLAIRLAFTDGTEGIFRISPPIFGDADGDLDVDAEDWAAVLNCWTGPGGPVEADCDVFDLDADGDVDLVDYSMFQQLFTG